MGFKLPGPKSEEILKKGPLLFKNGNSYAKEAAAARSRGFNPPPQMINVKTEGSWIIDADGNRIIDFHAGWASNPLGNTNSEIIETVTKAMKQYGFVYEHPLRYELAEKLIEFSPNKNKKLTRVNFEISGTEAAEAAVSYAIAHTGRPLIITFEDQFHGDSIAARMLGSNRGYDRRKGFEAWRGGVITVPYPHSFDIPAGMSFEQYTQYVIWYIEEFVCKKVAPPESIAGILMEPVLSEGGNWIPHPSFLPELRRLSDKFGWVLISDEVLSGMGRSGKMWAIDHMETDCDILVIGKHLTGGIEPIAAIQATEEVLGDNPGHSGSTFAGTPAGCAAALKTLEIMARDKLVERTALLGKKVLDRINKWPEQFSIVGQSRGLGFLLGASIINKDTGRPDADVALAIVNEALTHGAWLIWDSESKIRFYPALTIEEDTLEKGLTITEEAIWAVEKKFVKNEYPFYTTGAY